MAVNRIATLKKLAIQNKGEPYVLKICLLALYSEWEGFVNSKLADLADCCNKENKVKFDISKDYFKDHGFRIMNREIIKKICKKVSLDEEVRNNFFKDNGFFKIEKNFFEMRNKYAHGDLDSLDLEFREFEEYTKQVNETCQKFEDAINDFIAKKLYLKQP